MILDKSKSITMYLCSFPYMYIPVASGSHDKTARAQETNTAIASSQ